MDSGFPQSLRSVRPKSQPATIAYKSKIRSVRKDIHSFPVFSQDEFEVVIGKGEDDLGTVLHAAVSNVLGTKEKAAPAEEVAEVLERSLQWRAGNTAAEDYMSLCQCGALDEIAGPDRDEEAENDAKDQEEKMNARVKAAESITTCIRKIRSPSKSAASGSASDKSRKRKPVRFASSESWTAERVQGFLPSAKFGYKAFKDHFNKCFRVVAHRQRWSISKSWGSCGMDSVSVRFVLEKAWERHLSFHPEETCPWSFESICIE